MNPNSFTRHNTITGIPFESRISIFVACCQLSLAATEAEQPCRKYSTFGFIMDVARPTSPYVHSMSGSHRVGLIAAAASASAPALRSSDCSSGSSPLLRCRD